MSVELKKADDTKKEDVPSSSSQNPQFKFFTQLSDIHRMVQRTPGYVGFLFKFLPVQVIRIVTALSVPVAVHMLTPDIDDLTSTDKIVFLIIGILNVVGRLTPFITKMFIDDFKENLQEEQATLIVRKVFEMHHGAVLTTPTGEFSQLMSKVFRNLDVLLPSLYGDVLPMLVEALIAVLFITTAYGFIGIIQLLLFFSYTLLSFQAAKAKAERNKEFMNALFSEWGKIIAVASSYERAHFFDNVEHEISNAKGSFHLMGSKIKMVSRGEHKEAMFLQTVSLSVTALFLGVILASLSDDIEGLEMAALSFYFFTFISSLDAYALGISNLRTAVVEYQVFNSFVQKRSEVVDIENAVDIGKKSNPSIEFESVSFSYGGKKILDDVSFKIEGGGTLGIVGSSGCGKSTIMRLLLRFYRPSSGTIKVDGVDISGVKGDSLRRLFSVVTQDAALQNCTLRDNIGYGKMGSSDEEILNAAKLAELPLKADAGAVADAADVNIDVDEADKGDDDNDLTLDKVCGEKGGKLSGGQQQRVALARAMLKNACVYLLDEPTTGLDGVVAKKLQSTLNGLSENATTVMITHHLEDLKNATSILYLEDGRIIERGNFNDLIEQKGIFYRQIEARK